MGTCHASNSPASDSDLFACALLACLPKIYTHSPLALLACLTNDQVVIIGEVVRGHFEVQWGWALPYASRDVVM